MNSIQVMLDEVRSVHPKYAEKFPRGAKLTDDQVRALCHVYYYHRVAPIVVRTEDLGLQLKEASRETT